MGIFAKVLQEVLTAHQSDDFGFPERQKPKSDPIWHPLRRLAIAPAVVDRLKKAADSNNKRATLNPSDLDEAMRRLKFSDKEKAQLRAALLAQGVEMFLFDRMSDQESAVITKITEIVYNLLLERFDEPFHQIKEPKFRKPMSPDQRAELALSLADRIGTFIAAAKLAKEKKAQEELLFWQRLIQAGYQEIANLLRPIDPDAAAKFEKFAHATPEELLNNSPERDQPPEGDEHSEEGG
jgi:hypothetical protein